MRLPEAAHTSHPWRIHDAAPDFRLEDVWALPTPGEREDFPRLVQQFAGGDPSRNLPGLARTLWVLRARLGQLLRWDRPEAAVGARVASLRERLPDDLRAASPGPDMPGLPFSPLYMVEDEWAAEAANRTMHGVVHLGWVKDPAAAGGYRGQMAVLVKPAGLVGSLYMAAIRPFRHQIVYPAMMRQMEQAWRRDSP
jgi:hypothetical protein